MSEHFEYIDAYFQKQLSESERAEFEQRIANDADFANDVAFYISSRAAIYDVLLEQKKAGWSQLPIQQQSEAPARSAPVLRMINKKWILYAAAACLVLAIISFPLLSNDSPKKLADKYVSNKLSAISQTMDGSTDSIQSGIAAYNKKDYSTALQLFRQIYERHPENGDALRYLGQTYLITGNYDRALASFEALAQIQSYSNPGLFLKAVTLMKRNQGSDRQEARGLLQTIASNENLDGNREAKKWLKNWSD